MLLQMALMGFSVGCGGPREDFLEGRVRSACNDNFNVCDTVAACALADNNCMDGTLPMTRRTLVRVLEPSRVQVRVLVEEVSFSGAQTVMRFFEEGSPR
jgi:hypothetical protein